MENVIGQNHSRISSTANPSEIVQLAVTLFLDFKSILKDSAKALPSGISYIEARVLLCFTTVPALSISALARRLNVTSGWASRISGQLLTKGFLKACRSETDRRVVALSATDEAIKMTEGIFGAQQQIFATILGQFQAGERAVIADFFRRVSAAKRENPKLPASSARGYLVRELWQSRPCEKRKPTDVPEFYRWLEENHPRLLKRNCDPYFGLLRDLNTVPEQCIMKGPVE